MIIYRHDMTVLFCKGHSHIGTHLILLGGVLSFGTLNDDENSFGLGRKESPSSAFLFEFLLP